MTTTNEGTAPEIQPETEFERNVLVFLNNKEILFYSTLKAIRSDIATLTKMVQTCTTRLEPDSAE
jgi:hypothetical protein